jgi:hypothetical protein
MGDGASENRDPDMRVTVLGKSRMLTFLSIPGKPRSWRSADFGKKELALEEPNLD